MYEESKKGVPSFKEMSPTYLVFCPKCACYYTNGCPNHDTVKAPWLVTPVKKT